ncbi:hypothetical protein CVT24_001355 [Panaeolus cyanescens]|uniref:Transcription activator GCR1-like domain-containing protein n=1 Tax=Panaeolus cyanescens TaxID=181874 RepID=A0A409YFU3_9AGAR|nr:hypothetical protein CVT24_001355 [Panaeolus cyanescens]
MPDNSPPDIPPGAMPFEELSMPLIASAKGVEAEHSNDGMDEIRREAYEITQELQQEYQTNRGTKKAYQRHLKNYHTWWASDQTRRQSESEAQKRPFKPVAAQPITADKVLLFLKAEMNRQKKRGGSGEVLANTKLGISSIKQTITALEHYRLTHMDDSEYKACPDSQISLRNTYKIQEFERVAQAMEPKRQAQTQEAKAKGRLAQTLTTEQLIFMSKDLLLDPRAPKGSGKSHFHYLLRDRGMLLFTTAMALRGDDVRNILLSDLSVRDVEMPDLGLDRKVKALTIISTKSKTNTTGRVDLHTSFRHWNVNICSISALAFYLFSEYHVMNKSSPDFTPDFENPEATEYGYREWYDLVLFHPADSPKTPMTLENHIQHINDEKDAIGLGHVKKVTHIGRLYGATTAIANGATTDSVRALGLWSQPGAFDVYNRTLPTDAMVAAAGFNGRQLNSYFVSRDVLDPPENLMAQIFPWIEQEEQALSLRMSPGQLGPDIGCDGTLLEFLSLMKYLRRVLLQDAAVLYQQHSNAPVFRYSPFSSEEFQQFSSSATNSIQQSENLFQKKIDAAELPDRLTNTFKEMFTASTAKQIEIHQSVEALNSQLTSDVSMQRNALHSSLMVHATSSDSTLKRKALQDIAQSLDTYHPPSKFPRLADVTVPVPQIDPALIDPMLQPNLSALEAARVVQSSYQPATPVPPSFPSLVAVVATNQTPAMPPHNSSTILPTALPIANTLDSTFVSGTGNVYVYRTFPSLLTANIQQQVNQMKALNDLERKIKPEKIKCHTFEWIDSAEEWLPEFETFWKPKNPHQAPTLEEIWKEYTEGMGGRLSIEELNKQWGARWKRNRGAIKVESARRSKVVRLIQKLSNKPEWDAQKALQFLRAEFNISPGSANVHLKSLRNFIEWLQKKEFSAEELIVAASALYTHS